MKIVCIGRNYSEHIKELKNDVPEEPVIFIKPDSSVLRNNAPFFLPAFSQDIHHEVELYVRITKLGKAIPEKFAKDYYDEIGLGIDFTARDVQTKLKGKGLPWEKAKGFDHSAVIGKSFPKENFDLNNLNFRLENKNGLLQKGNSADMIQSIDAIISHVSHYFTLKKGDLIFTGTPAGVSAVKAGDVLEGFIEDQSCFKFKVL
jgi:acylpyruvate hydrolase